MHDIACRSADQQRPVDLLSGMLEPASHGAHKTDGKMTPRQNGLGVDWFGNLDGLACIGYSAIEVPGPGQGPSDSGQSCPFSGLISGLPGQSQKTLGLSPRAF